MNLFKWTNQFAKMKAKQMANGVEKGKYQWLEK